MKRQTLATLVVLTLLLIIAMLLTLWFIALNQREKADSKAQQTLASVPEAVFEDGEGVAIDLSEYSNSVRVVNSWATWSPYSKDELPQLETLAKEFESQGVIFIAINRQESQAYTSSYLDSIGDFFHLKIVYDPSDTFFDRVEGYAMPETIVFDKKGEVALHVRGVANSNEIRTVLSRLVAQ